MYIAFYVNEAPGGQQNQQSEYEFTLDKIRIIGPKLFLKLCIME